MPECVPSLLEVEWCTFLHSLSYPTCEDRKHSYTQTCIMFTWHLPVIFMNCTPDTGIVVIGFVQASHDCHELPINVVGI